MPSPIDPTNAAQVQYTIVELMGGLEELIEQYRTDTRQAAVSHAEYKRVYAIEMLRVIDAGQARNAEARQAMTEVATNDERATSEVHQAQADSTRAALFAKQAALDAARSLNANVRNVS